MKKFCFFLIAVSTLPAVFVSCSKSIEQEIQKPQLFITLKDDTGKAVQGARVTLYKNINDTGITQLSDSTGVVLFTGLEPTLYHWLAEKGCKTNRVSQTTLNRDLIPDVVLYGFSVLTETGTIKIINNSPEPYKLSDSLFNVSVNKDTPYIAHRRVRSYLLHTEKISTPGIIKDTLINIRCGDTTVLTLPF